MTKKGFTSPKLHDCGGDLKKEWFVDFRFTDPGTGIRKPFQFRMGINWLQTKSERYAEGRAIIAVLSEALSQGWNPHEKSYQKHIASFEAENAKDILETALKLSFENKTKGSGERTVQAYKTVYNAAVLAAANICMSNLPVNEIKRGHIKRLLDEIQVIRQAEYDKEGRGKVFNGNTYNKYLRFLGSLFTEMYERYDIENDNPCSKVSMKKEVKTGVHRHATVEEERLIKDHLRNKDFGLYVFLAIEELTGIRPKEILSLQVCDIDRLSQSFVLTHNKTKTGNFRRVPIPNTLLPLLAKLKLAEVPETHFIFSTDLKPGPKQYLRPDALVTDRWNQLVKKELRINVSLYSFKGLGADKRIDAGIQKATVSKGLGHTNIKTTDIYLERESERQRRHLIENTPEF